MNNPVPRATARALASPPSDAILERLKALHPKAIDLSLGRVERLLAKLGHPERRLPPVVHISGTNGKGSVLADLEAMLIAAGYDVDAYVSPHLVRFSERIRRHGRPIEEEALTDLLEACERANAGDPITFFEITTAAAFLAFARDPADILLLEVGLGGRLDATNVVARPGLSVITPVSIDHTHYLGETLAEIADEKAGILKPGVSAVIGAQEPEAAAAIEARAELVGAPLRRCGHEWHAEAKDGALLFSDRAGAISLPMPALVGPHQIDNAGVAVACAKALDGFSPSDEAIAQGLQRAVWPGRLQRTDEVSLPPAWELWLDGGHNPSAGAALARAVAAWDDKPLHLVVGMLNTKPPAEFLAPLAPLAASLVAVPVPGEPASLAPAEICQAVGALSVDARTAESVEAALRSIVAGEQGPARILVCGSLYLVGSVLAGVATS